MSQQINLYSPLFRKQRKLFTARAMVQSLVLVVAALALFYGYARHQVQGLEQQAADLDRRLKTAMDGLKPAPGAPLEPGDEKTLDASIKELQGRLRASEELAEQAAQPARTHYLEPLRALARRRLEGVWLTTISLEGESGELSLVGRARSAALVPQYIERLGQDPAMKGRRFSTLSIEAEAPVAAKPGAGAAAPAAGGGVDFRLAATAGGSK